MVGGPDAFEHRITERVEGDEGMIAIGDRRCPRDEQRMREDVVVAVEDEGDDVGPGAHRCDVKGQVRDGHGLREQTCELSVDANRGIQEQERRAEGRGPERRLPPRTGQRRPGFEPRHDVRAIRPVLHERQRRRLPPSATQSAGIGDRDAFDLRHRAQCAEE